jgi:ribosomal protein S18 acetylase RimI-like enzyme
MEDHQMISIKSMSGCPQSQTRALAEVFVDAYDADLSRLTKEKTKLMNVFEKAINPEVFLAAELQGEIVGILACSTNRQRGLVLNKHDFRREFGLLMGTIAYRALGKDFNRQLPYPLNTGYIECVGTLRTHRGMGIASSLVQHALSTLKYDRYVLEVSDSNKSAYRLYQKLGFHEFERKKAKWPMLEGYREMILMEYHKA